MGRGRGWHSLSLYTPQRQLQCHKETMQVNAKRACVGIHTPGLEFPISSRTRNQGVEGVLS